jgi:hypothetical protein
LIAAEPWGNNIATKRAVPYVLESFGAEALDPLSLGGIQHVSNGGLAMAKHGGIIGEWTAKRANRAGRYSLALGMAQVPIGFNNIPYSLFQLLDLRKAAFLFPTPNPNAGGVDRQDPDAKRASHCRRSDGHLAKRLLESCQQLLCGPRCA